MITEIENKNIIKELLKEVKENEIDKQLKYICDKISLEEKVSLIKYLPKGPNMFLVLPTLKNTLNQECFLSLEREFPGEYIVRLWALTNSKMIPNSYPIETIETDKVLPKYIVSKFWKVNENTSEKIITFYAKVLKFTKGE